MRRIKHDLADDNIDREVIERLRKMGGNELVLGLVDLYLKGNPDKMDELFQAMKIPDFGPIQRSSHSLISSAGNLGGK